MRERLTPNARGILLATVGLPARGKSFISRRLERFLEWKGMATRTFNAGKYRRDHISVEESGRSGFFDAKNGSAVAAREAAAAAALGDALAFLDEGGRVAIFDATNSTVSRREQVIKRVKAHCASITVVFVEVICDDAQVVDANMRNKVENSPDFDGIEIEEALADLNLRIRKYEEVYETVRDDEGSFIKLYNLSSKVTSNHVYGNTARSILPYLMGIHIGARPIFLARAGAGELAPKSFGSSNRLSRLSKVGCDFASTLAEFIQCRSEAFFESAGRTMEPVQVYTSTLPRAVATVRHLTPLHEETSMLNPIDKGAIGEGWWDIEGSKDIPPWDEFAQRHPEQWAELQADPLRFRFPGGESYMDVLRRLEGMIIEVEQCTAPVLIVSHVTVLQLLLAYFGNTPIGDAWKLPVPKGVVFEVTPTLGGGFLCEEHTMLRDGDASTSAGSLTPRAGGHEPNFVLSFDEVLADGCVRPLEF